jgi:hypothetical protein
MWRPSSAAGMHASAEYNGAAGVTDAMPFGSDIRSLDGDFAPCCTLHLFPRKGSFLVVAAVINELISF